MPLSFRHEQLSVFGDHAHVLSLQAISLPRLFLMVGRPRPQDPNGSDVSHIVSHVHISRLRRNFTETKIFKQMYSVTSNIGIRQQAQPVKDDPSREGISSRFGI